MSKRYVVRISVFVFAVWVSAAVGQTRIDLKNQSRAVDFSGAVSTKPAKSGSALPTNCGTGEVYLLTTAVPGSNLYVCTATNVWSLQGSGGAATAPNTLIVSQTSNTVLTIGASCTASKPCNVRAGSSTYSFLNSATATLTGGTGTAYLYVSAAGVLTVGHNVSLSCAGGCVAQTGVTGFPVDSTPIASWSASNGTWLAAGGADMRSFLNKDYVTTGVGLMTVSGAGYQSISVDQAAVGLRTVVPGSSASACTQGAWAVDSSYYYICVATNTWKRGGLSSW